MLSPWPRVQLSSPTTAVISPEITRRSSSESPWLYGSSPAVPPGASVPENTSTWAAVTGVSWYLANDPIETSGRLA